jgi:hypothetical protein
MELTSDNVQLVFHDCLFANGEDAYLKILHTQGVKTHAKFNIGKLEKHKADIESMLQQLHRGFRQNSVAQGASFLQFCITKNEVIWTDLHVVCDYLLCLGLAIQKVQFLTPRMWWPDLPGGVPLIQILI